MHLHFTDTFEGRESGLARREYARQATIDGGGGSTVPVVRHRPVKDEDGKVRKVPVTATDQVKETIKDGTFSKAEKTAFAKTPATRDIVKSEQERLSEAVRKADGTRPDRVTGGRSAYVAPVTTEHRQRVAELGEGETADDLTGRIKDLKDSGVTTGVELLQDRRDDRLAEEAKVVDVIVDKTAYVGTLQVEKDGLVAGGETEKIDKLRDKAAPLLEQFIAAEGQVHEGDLVGDDWDGIKAEDADAAFDEVAEGFLDDPDRLEEFVAHQGDDHDAIENWDEHLADIDDPEMFDNVVVRKEVAEKLAPIFEQYVELQETSEGSEERIEAIDAEIDDVRSTISTDRDVLSTRSENLLDRELAPTRGIIPELPVEQTVERHAEDTSGSEGSGGMGSDRNSGHPTNPDITGPTGADAAERRAEQDRVEKVDYTTPEGQQRVVQQAAKRNLLPPDVTFDKQGQAVYTVQPNDSYWRIAEMSSGKDGLDAQHFLTTAQSNSERLGRDPVVGLIHPGEKVYIPGRSIEELVMLMDLPKTADEQQ